MYPFTPEELNVKYEFESVDGKEDFIILDYYVVYPTFSSITKRYNINNNLLNNYKDDMFIKFFKEEMKKYTNNINIPNIFEMFDKYNEINGIFKKINETNKQIK